ncbi:MAG: succinate--CoA ligase subunit alpha [Dehalococcoidia bacterium]
MRSIVNEDTRVLVQGITGREGSFHATRMKNYGTKVVAGVTPGKGGQTLDGIPVYDTVSEAASRHDANTSILFVPARAARHAVLEALAAGIKTLVIITEGIPQRDAIDFINEAKRCGDTIIVGPNTPGVIDPKIRTKIGIMPHRVFCPGTVAIASRSGTLTYEIAHHISVAGLGQSVCVGLGGDAITGLDFIDTLKMFNEDEATRAVVLVGEIGGNAEELAAQYIAETHYPKPVAAYVAGRFAPPGKRMGHAGAIIMGSAGTARSKIDAFIAAGVAVAERPGDVARLLQGMISADET